MSVVSGDAMLRFIRGRTDSRTRGFPGATIASLDPADVARNVVSVTVVSADQLISKAAVSDPMGDVCFMVQVTTRPQRFAVLTSRMVWPRRGPRCHRPVAADVTFLCTRTRNLVRRDDNGFRMFMEPSRCVHMRPSWKCESSVKSLLFEYVHRVDHLGHASVTSNRRGRCRTPAGFHIADASA